MPFAAVPNHRSVTECRRSQGASTELVASCTSSHGVRVTERLQPAPSQHESCCPEFYNCLFKCLFCCKHPDLHTFRLFINTLDRLFCPRLQVYTVYKFFFRMSSPTSPTGAWDTFYLWTEELPELLTDAMPTPATPATRRAHARMFTAMDHAQQLQLQELQHNLVEAEIRNGNSDFRIAQLEEELENLNRRMLMQTRMFVLERNALQAAQDEIARLKQILNREGIWESLHQRIEQLEAENEQLQAANEQLKAANDALNVKFNCHSI